jgi:glycosyltransferase involved in cell wall biosynthesis
MKLRVLLLGPLPPPMSGPETMVEALVQHLGRFQEIEFTHINTQISRSLADKGKRPLVKAFKSLRHTLFFLWLLITFRPDVVHLVLTNSESFGGFLRDALVIIPGWLAGAKVVVRLNGGVCRYMRYTGWRGRMVHTVLSRVTLVMVEGYNLTRLFDPVIPPARVVAVPNAVDQAPFAAARARARATGTEGKRRIVLFVGLLCEAKGVHDILRAAPAIPDAEFVFLGEWASPEEQAAAMALIRDGGIEQYVSFPGVLSGEAKYDRFAAADVFVFPSYYFVEGHAVVTVEALAAGLPIICTDHGALTESVQDGWNGFLVPSRDPHTLALRVNQVLGDAMLRETMRQRSLALYEERFTFARHVEIWVRTLVDRIGVRRPAARSS